MPNPVWLVYRRQYYDAGESSTMKCRFCGRDIRFIYLLKDPWNNTLPIGRCCFDYLKEFNPEVYQALQASAVLLEAQVKDIQGDSQQQKDLAIAQVRKMEWSTTRKAARRLISEFRKLSGEGKWLPKHLFDMQQALQNKPRTNYRSPLSLARWYERHTRSLKEMLSAYSQ